MRFVAGVICALVILGLASVAYVYSGWFDVAASSPHNALERWALNTTMKRSVVAGAQSVGDPPAFSDEMVRDGFEHYDEMCTVCHAGPGIERSEIERLKSAGAQTHRRGQSVDASSAVLDYQARREDDRHAVIWRDA